MSDEILTCVECGRKFTWSSGEQTYYRERGLSQPKRCPDCRSQRRAERQPGMRGEVGSVAEPAIHDQRKWTEAARKAQPPVADQRRWTEAARATQPSVVRRGSWWTDPVRRYLLITFALTIILAVIVAQVRPSFDPVLSWLIAINLVAFLTYGYDKAISGTTMMRVPESVLLALALPFGTLGALAGMKAFHHKTAKGTFQLKFGVVVVIQILLLAIYFYFKPQVFK